MERKTVTCSQCFEIRDFGGKITSIVGHMERLIEEHGESVRFSVEFDEDVWADQVSLVFTRYETDDEMANRLKREVRTRKAREAKAAKQKAKDLRTLKRLHKKYPEET